MRRQCVTIVGLLLLSGLLVSGCTRKAAVRKPTPPPPKGQQARTEQQSEQQRKQEEEAGPPRTPTSVKMEKLTTKVVDPKGQWTFEAQAEAMTAASAQGPYTMQQATGVYRHTGQPPVQMRADKIIVDEGAKRVTLIGSVRLATPTMQVEGPRIEYNLDTQEVRAEGLTKMTYRGTAVAGTAGSRESGIRLRQGFGGQVGDRGRRETAGGPVAGG